MRRKVLSLVLALCMVLSLMPMTAFAAPGDTFHDVDGHWGQSAIERWSEYGVVNGDGTGGFAPDKQMTRAEFATMLANMLGYKDKAANTFADVNDSDWFADAILKLAAAGVIQGSNGMANPNAPISRQEAAVMMCRAFNIPTTGGNLDFADSADVADWAKGAVAALADRGMMNGVGNNNVAPLADINRASVATLLDNMITEYVTEDKTITGEVSGIVLVAADATVTVENATLNENLIVAPKADGAEVALTGTTTASDVVVGATATVKVESTASAGTVQVAAANSTVEVAGKADAVTVDSAANNTAVNVTESAAVGDVALNAADTKVSVAENASVSNVAVSGSNANVEVSGKVDNVTVSSGATGTGITANSGATVGKVDTSANDVTVSGSGKVENVTANDGTVSVTTPGTSVENKTDSKDNVTNNGKPVEPSTGGSETPTTPSGGGGGGGGGDDPGETKAYTITYNLNGGTNPADAPTGFDEGDTVTLPTPTKTGYTFNGWYKEEGFTNKVETLTTTGTQENPLANVTLWAKWTANTYTITLNPNGGTVGDTSTVTATYNEVVTGLPTEGEAIPTKANYTFKGWSLTPDGTVATEIKNLTAEANGTAILYAVWELNEGAYELNFVFVDATTGNSITGVTAKTNTYPQSGKKDAVLSVGSGSITVVGYTVTDGLFAAATGGEKLTEIAANSVSDDSHTVYVRLTENATYGVTYSLNGNSEDSIQAPAALENQRFTATVTLPDLEDTTHYTFKGWATASDATEVLTAPVTVAGLLGGTESASITLYAIWEANTYTVTFDVNGGTGTFANQSVKYNEKATAPVTTPTKNNNTFLGWYTSEAKFDFNTPITGDITLKATWEPVDEITAMNDAIFGVYKGLSDNADATKGPWSGIPANLAAFGSGINFQIGAKTNDSKIPVTVTGTLNNVSWVGFNVADVAEQSGCYLPLMIKAPSDVATTPTTEIVTIGDTKFTVQNLDPVAGGTYFSLFYLVKDKSTPLEVTIDWDGDTTGTTYSFDLSGLTLQGAGSPTT